MEDNYNKHDIDENIEDFIKAKLSLKQVKSVLEVTYSCELSEFDCHYVEDKYIELLMSSWLDKGPELVINNLCGSSEILNFANSLNELNSYQDCKKYAESCYFMSLIIDLSKHSKKLKDCEQDYVFKFKYTCLYHLFLQAGDVKNDIEFIQCFVEVMKCSTDLEQLFLELEIQHFLMNKCSLQNVLGKLDLFVPSNKLILNLQQVGKEVLKKNSFILIKNLQDCIRAFLVPVTVSESAVDGRVVLEVSGTHIVISKILTEIESEPRFSRIDEVRFVRAFAIHADVDLKQSIWHGKNIVVFAETLIVNKDRHIVWDISGNDSTDFKKAAQTANHGCGLTGSEGNPGESGGNVLIIVDSLKNEGNLTIISNGGNGSRGQDGGNGKDGEDGKSIGCMDFKKQFPPVSKLKNDLKLSHLKTTMGNIQLQFVKTFYWAGTRCGMITNETFYKYFSNMIKTKKLVDFYFEVLTNDGCEIIFSFCFEGLFTFCQSFLLHRGSPGKEGKPGGAGGVGGRGGFSGDIDIDVCISHSSSCITVIGENGKQGSEGNTGLFGKPGNNGLDIAYMDCSKSISGGKWPKIFVVHPKDDKRLTIEYFNDDSSDRVVCPHNRLYAKVTEMKKSKVIKIQQKVNLKAIYTQRTVQVTRKKTINKKDITEQYKQIASNLDIQKLSSTMKDVMAILSKIIPGKKIQTDQVVADKTFKKQVNYFSYKFPVHTLNILKSKYTCKQAEKSIPQVMTNNPLSPMNACDSNNLKQSTLNLHQLQNLWNNTDEKITLKQIEFCDIYKLAVLEHVRTSIKKHNFIKKDSKNDIMLNNVQINFTNNIFHVSEDQHPFNEINEYFFEDSDLKREFILKQFERLTIDDICFKRSIRVFIHELGDDFSGQLIVQVLCKKYNLLEASNEDKLNAALVPINNLLERTEFSELQNILIKSIREQHSDLFLKFASKSQENKFLNQLLNIYSSKAVRRNDWITTLLSKKSDREKELREHFSTSVMEKGPFAAFYREFLAYYFNCNILVYSLNEYNQMVLTSNHNPGAKDLIPILINKNKFYQLKVDNEFVEMIKMHKAYGMLYSKILLHADSFGEKHEFDKFISKSDFLSDAYTGIDKSRSIQVKILQIMTQDDNIKIITETFQSSKDRLTVGSRLEKLKLEYIGYHNILYYMALHFKIEGNHVTTKEFYIIINFVLKSAIFTPETMPLVCWIIAAYHQTNWLIEITLLTLEQYFKKTIKHETKQTWRTYLCDQNEKDRLMLFCEKINEDTSSKLNLQQVNEILYLFSNIPSAHIGIEELDLSEWKYYLKDRYWMYQLSTCACWPEDQLNLASFYLVSLENVFGIELIRKFFDVLKKQANGVDPTSIREFILNTFKMLHNKEIYLDDRLIQKLSNKEINHWQKEIEVTCAMSGQERSLSKLVDLIQNSGNTSDKILKSLYNISKSVEKCNTMISKLEQYIKCENTLKIWISDIIKVLEKVQKPDEKSDQSIKETIQLKDIVSKDYISLFHSILNTNSNLENNSLAHTNQKVCYEISLNDFKKNLHEILLSTIVKAISITLSPTIVLRNTQKLAIITILESGYNVLSQISTGEGKSLIVVSVAIIKAVKCQKIDIITSSRVLAERDAHDYKNLYKLFDVHAGHNCSENIEDRKKAYSNCQVIYGELGHFQRDYLLDNIYDKNILGDRKRQTVLVDEVDSMMLDKGNSTLYLSHDIPGLDKLEPLFIFIWKWLNMRTSTDQSQTQINIAELKERILFEMYGQIKKEHIKELDMNLTLKQIDKVWKTLIKENIISRKGRIEKENIDYSKLKSELECLIDCDHLQYLLRKVTERVKSFEVPNYLKEFVEAHLDRWIENGVRALSMENGRDYVVDIDRSNTSISRSPNITIVDQNTGTDQPDSQWDEGLHQFLQLKHGCRLSLISLKAVFISNVSYLKLYGTIYGLSGTLGSCRERELLKEVYAVDFVTIPTAKTKSFTEEISIACSDTEQWANTIFEKIYKITESRSALVICETVNDVLYLAGYFNNMAMSSKKPFLREIHTYTRDYEKLSVADNLEPGHIIISTNLAGRGTDIKLSEKLINAGGLFVCLSYLPNNSRVEEQAYGRSARNGQPGSAQMIFISGSQNTPSNIVNLKKLRDINELLRISDIKTYYDTQIKPEEECFGKFKESYLEIIVKLNDHHIDIKSVLLQHCLDQWAFWLDCNTKQIASVSVEHFTESILKLENNDFKIWSKCINDPFQLTKLGLVYLKMKQNEKAISLFDRVIKEEECFCESAHYYKICAKARSAELKSSELIEDIETVKNKFKACVNSSLISAHIIDWLKDRNPRSLLQIDSYKEQQINISNIYSIFLDSINNVTGHDISSAEALLPSDMFDTYTSYRLYNELIEENIIEKSVKATITENDLSFISNYGISVKQIKTILDKHKKKFNEKDFLKELKKCLPTRELFWKELLNRGILENEEKYVFVELQSLECTPPFLSDAIKKLFADVSIRSNSCIWLYNTDNFKPTSDQSTHSVLKTDQLRKTIGDKLYKYLKRTNVISCNKRATICLPSNVDRFKYFDVLNVEDFDKINVGGDIASKLIADLEKNHVIDHLCESQSTYTLNINIDETQKIKLSTFKAYEDDVKALLNTSFAFRIAFQEMNYFISKHDSDLNTVCLPLPPKLHNQLLEQLIEEGIIVGPVINPKIDIREKLEKLYPQSMDHEKLDRLFTELYDDCATRSEIIRELIKHKWLLQPLKDKILTLKKKLLTTYNPSKYYINTCINNKEYTEKNPLAPSMKEKIEPIKFILSSHITLCAKLKNIKELLEARKGCLFKVEIPSFTFDPLLTILHKNNMPTNECSTFSLNGFDEVMTLEENRWCCGMKVYTFCVLALGITEVAVGAVLTTCFPYFAPVTSLPIMEGIGDMIYALRCFYSGYFSSKDYCTTKLISLTLSFGLSMHTTIKIYKATYAQSIGITFESVKGNWRNVLEKSVEATKNVFGFSKKAVDKTTFIKTVVKRAVSTTAIAVAQSAAYATLDEIIKPSVMKLGEVITDVIYTDIDNTIQAHPVVELVGNIYYRFGKKKTESVINTCLKNIVKQHEDVINDHLKNTFSLINTTIEANISKFIKESCSYKSVSKRDMVCTIMKITNILIKLFMAGQTYFVNVKDLVSKVLDNVANTLQKQFFKDSHCNSIERPITGGLDKELDYLIFDTTSNFRIVIKQMLSDHISLNIITPVMQATSNSLVDYSNRILLKKCVTFFTTEEVRELAKLKNKYSKTNDIFITEIFERPDAVDTDYNKFLFELFQKKQSATLFSEIMRKNCAVDTNCIQLCCEIIPLTLRKEGIPIPGFEIILEFDGVQESYKTVEAGIDVPTIIIAPNEGLKKNISSNKICVKTTIDIVLNALLKDNPQLIGFTSELLYNLILSKLENDTVTQQFVNMYGTNEPTNIPNPSINTTIEKNISYQHLHTEGSWKFIPSVDVDLRKENKLSHLSHVESQIQEGFKIAVQKINSHIFSIQNVLKHPFNIDLEDFSETKHKIIPETKNTTICDFRCYPIQYELVIPLPLETYSELVNFGVTMSLKNKIDKVQPYSPHGPHILYEIKPVTDMKHFWKGVKGHVLLNKECQDYSYSINDCIVAGDLILPSTFNYQESISFLQKPISNLQESKKSCGVLIVGDSCTFKHISDFIPACIMQFTCKTICYPGQTSSRNLHSQIYPLINQFTGVQCVVLYMGNSSITTKITEGEIAKDIGNTVIEIQSYFEHVNIIMCSLLLNQYSASKNNEKIDRINKYLYSFCATMNMIYLDINSCLDSSECRKKGAYLNKKGYIKLGQIILGTVKTTTLHK